MQKVNEHISVLPAHQNQNIKKIKEIIGFLQIPRGILHIFLMEVSPYKAVIEKDIDRWLYELGYPGQLKLGKWRSLVLLLWRFPAFRNLFYYRITSEERISSRVVLAFAEIFFRPMNTLYIYTPAIGAGLFIQHGFSTIISAKSIGQNCWINQQVTIGYANLTDTPTIGDDVHISAGAIVFGDITIGSNSTIGANSVVFKDVPPNCTVVGVPAYIVKCNGKKVKSPL